jgi:DNA-binding beta-propeller fold protein YncE
MRLGRTRRPIAATALAAICLAGAACSSGAADRSVASAVMHTQRRAPGCSTQRGRAPELAHVKIVMTKVPFAPFGVTAVPGGRFYLVAATFAPASVAVFANRAGAGPKLVRRIRLLPGIDALGTHLTSDGRYLLVADGVSGAVVVSVGRAVQGTKDAVRGVLSASHVGGSIEVTSSIDGRFAFVSLEGSESIAVYNLGRALSRGFSRADLVGLIPVGLAPVGMAVSPDGRWLYATSELAAHARSVRANGTLTVINVKTAESWPAKSVATTVDAGCQPVRVITSADGSTVWVTARGSDALLGFNAHRLVRDPGKALVAVVRVGIAPVGLALVDAGSKIVIADSDRFHATGATASLAVVDVASALAGRKALIGYLPAGSFPREMAAAPGGQILLVGNFASDQMESVTVAELP